ncbi:hypothetical protein UFOVP117_149 [uncultured Caudovirales phage]|uniref:Uncharacterized protein n=1 Tax=uncultured Caudovirales phage TaxID=2100421 RepID=A0A6J5L577_9CAUD|nr:hypothetical protein UFOVP117_149 [uncultured Caudovirales phage]
MKYLISEEQNKFLKEELDKPNFERLINKLFEKQVSRGEQPHIDNMIMDFFEVDVWERDFNILIELLRDFLGREQSVKLTEELLQKTFKTDRYNFSGGYRFEFKVTPIIHQEEGQMWVEVYILPGGVVDLFLTGNGITDLKEALNDQSIGFEIENEVKEIIDEIFTEEITYKTGARVDLETLVI